MRKSDQGYAPPTRYSFGEGVGAALTLFFTHAKELMGTEHLVIQEVLCYPIVEVDGNDSLQERLFIIHCRQHGHAAPAELTFQRRLDFNVDSQPSEWTGVTAKGWARDSTGGWTRTVVQMKS